MMNHRVALIALGFLAAAPSSLLAQSSVRADTMWVAQDKLGVGREFTVRFADATARSAFPRDEAPLATVDGKAWRFEDILVTVDVGAREPSITWRVSGPQVVVEAFEASLRRRARAASIARSLKTRQLVVRCACTP